MLHYTYEQRALRVVLGTGAAGLLAGELDQLGVRRALFITTAGRAPLARRIASAVASSELFADARLHVPVAVVDQAFARAAGHQADALVAVGGGSAIGVAKAVALRTDLPIVAVPTTYSGSEMTAIWGVTEGDTKRTGRDARVAPRLVIYDPELTLDLDPLTSAASGMNAVAHCVEALWAPDAHPLASLIAEQGIRVMADSLPRVVRAPADVPARSAALHAAHLAGRALDMTTMGLHHKICHVLGGMFGLPHALTHAIVLPHVVAFNTAAATGALAAIARGLRGFAPHTDADSAAHTLHDLNLAFGITDSLETLGLRAADVTPAAERIAAAGVLHPRPITAEEAASLLHAVRRGDLRAARAAGD